MRVVSGKVTGREKPAGRLSITQMLIVRIASTDAPSSKKAFGKLGEVLEIPKG